MTKQTCLTAWLLCFCLAANAQTPRVDTIALVILDRMSDIIGDLDAVSFTVDTDYDVVTNEFGLVKHASVEKVYIQGPDKMLVNSIGDKGHRSFWYNGEHLTYYSFENNRYGRISAPGNILLAIDTVSKTYGIDFPAADFFYPTFTDDLLALSNSLVFLGITQLKGKECFHIAATSMDYNIQIWVNNDELTLPAKMVVVYNTVAGNPQYEATFSNWTLNPVLPAAMFDFPKPPGAGDVKIEPLVPGK